MVSNLTFLTDASSSEGNWSDQSMATALPILWQLIQCETADMMTADQLKLMTICREPLSPHCCAVVTLRARLGFVSDKPGALLLFHSTGDATRMQCNAHVWPSASFDTSSSVSCWAGCSPVYCKGREGWMMAESMFNFFLLFKRRELSGSNWIFTTTRGYESDSHQSWRWERNEIYPWLGSLNTSILSSGLCQTQKLFSLLLPKHSTARVRKWHNL